MSAETLRHEGALRRERPLSRSVLYTALVWPTVVRTRHGDYVQVFKLTAAGKKELAKRLGTTVQTVNRIIRGRQAITAPMAIRLARVLKTTPRLWLSLQADVELWRAMTGR